MVTYLHDNNLFFHPMVQRAREVSELLKPFLPFNVEELQEMTSQIFIWQFHFNDTLQI